MTHYNRRVSGIRMTKSGSGEYPFYRVFDKKRYYYHSFKTNRTAAEQEAQILRDKGWKVRMTKGEKAHPSPHYILWIRGKGINEYLRRTGRAW